MSREGAAKMQSYEVIFYDLEDGTEPAKEFLLSLDVKMRAKMLRTLTCLPSTVSSCVSRTLNRLTTASLSCGQKSAQI